MEVKEQLEVVVMREEWKREGSPQSEQSEEKEEKKRESEDKREGKEEDEDKEDCPGVEE